MKYSKTERLGVNATETLILDDFGWIFREQPIVDMGIDAHIEIVDNNEATGQLIALQIKTGASHFTISDEFLTYYGENKHLDYWINHSLPVLLIAHLPDQGKTYWEFVEYKKITQTKLHWKINIPKSQELSKTFITELKTIGKGSIVINNRRKLLVDKPLMDIIDRGGKVCVEFHDWVHKSLGRTPVKIFVQDDKEEYIAREWPILYTGYENDEWLSLVFPWANISVDSEFYELYGEEESIQGLYDIHSAIYPYKTEFSEVAFFRVSLHLNNLGKSFLTYFNFIENGEVI